MALVCDVVFGWDSSDVLYENSILRAGTRFPDVQHQLTSQPLESSGDNDTFFLLTFQKNNLDACPRTLLKKLPNKHKMLAQVFLKNMNGLTLNNQV